MKERTLRALRRTAIAGLKVAVIGAALVLVAAVSAYLTVRRAVSGRDVLVPDVVGMSSTEADQVLRRLGLAIETVTERHDPRTEAGHVLAQEPVPGSSIKVDRKVKVVLSLGEEGSTVPDLRGGAARMAQISLQQQGYRVARQAYVHAARAEENIVLAQDPLPGEFGARDGRVSILVSRGRRSPVYVMPDFTGRSEEEAMRVLSRAGLRVAPTRRESSASAAPGTILRQRPESGYPVTQGDLIMLFVAEGEGGEDHE